MNAATRLNHSGIVVFGTVIRKIAGQNIFKEILANQKNLFYIDNQ